MVKVGDKVKILEVSSGCRWESDIGKTGKVLYVYDSGCVDAQVIS